MFYLCFDSIIINQTVPDTMKLSCTKEKQFINMLMFTDAMYR